jgi:hypothetical protein
LYKAGQENISAPSSTAAAFQNGLRLVAVPLCSGSAVVEFLTAGYPSGTISVGPNIIVSSAGIGIFVPGPVVENSN